MRTLKIKILALFMGAALVFGSQQVQAQGWNVESVKMELKRGAQANLADCVKWIEEAAVHPKTSNSAKMHYYRGLTYLTIATDYPDLSTQHPDALEIALKSFNKTLELDSKNRYSDDTKKRLLNVAIAYYYKGDAAFKVKSYDEAISAFNTALDLLKYDVDGDLKRSNLTSDVLVQMVAYSALGKEDNALAKASFQTLVDNGFDDPNIYSALAQLQLIDGDTTTALETITDGREMYELDNTLINMELDIYLKQGRSQELINKLNAAIEQDPENVIYYFARAISYEGLGNIEQASADYDKIIEIDPTYYDAYYNKGVMHLKQVAALVDEYTEKGIYLQKDLQAYQDKIDAHHKLAIEQFDYVFKNNDEMSDDERMELAREMKKIYANLRQMEDYERMKTWIEENQ